MGLMAALVGAQLVGVPRAGAIAYPTCDSTVEDCGHVSVAQLSGFDAAGVSFYRCSGSLIHKDDAKAVFLTAAHCTAPWLTGLGSGELVTIGVSMDPVIVKDLSPDRFSTAQFATGGVPVQLPGAGSGSSAVLANMYNAEDLGVVVFPIAAVDARWPGRATEVLAQDVGLDLDTLVASFANPRRDLVFSVAGYGIREAVKYPGSQNAGGAGADGSTVGVLRVSDHQAFQALHELTVLTSQNPARGNTGSCDGDSGGPNYYSVNGVHVQVGVTSTGDAVCRASAVFTRTDSAAAAAFIACTEDSAKTVAEVKSCGTSV